MLSVCRYLSAQIKGTTDADQQPAVCECSTDTNTHVSPLTYDSVGQAEEVVRRDGRSVIPHLINKVKRDGLKAAVAGLQVDVVVLMRF